MEMAPLVLLGTCLSMARSTLAGMVAEDFTDQLVELNEWQKDEHVPPLLTLDLEIGMSSSDEDMMRIWDLKLD
jgi:hypothetical protein